MECIDTCVVVAGGSRYVPGGAAASGEPSDAAKTDPFTGSTRYLPAGAVSSTAGCNTDLLPLLCYLRS